MGTSLKMDGIKVTRAALGVLVLIQLCCQNAAYEIPDVRIEALSPKGFRASIPDAPKLSLFAFQGNINRGITSSSVGSLSGEVVESTRGRWIYEDPNVELKVGDVVNYYVFVSVDGAGYLKDSQSYTITALGDSSPDACQPTLTRVRGGAACAGQTIFEENFDVLKEDVWQVEHYIPVHHPEFPFVSYQRLQSDPSVSIVDGHLRITPKLQQNQPGFTNDSIYSGSLDLFGSCTGSADECSAQAWGANILPPVVSGRLTSKGFAFVYGTVHIRAKLPKGDWLYPEILLEPFLKKYGKLNYASGVLKIASARGNKELYTGVTDYSNKVLYGGPIMTFKCRQFLITDKKLNTGRMWGDDYHLYSVKWTPDRITLMVDLEEWAHIEPSAKGLSEYFSPTCHDLPRQLLATGTKMAPFDDYFYITLGVAAGGISEFRDDLYTQGGRSKPWHNTGHKARFQFWRNSNSWLQTWAGSEMLVDSVKVVALE